jgi:pimeloyl-ACP methyl ester carboxylesterase
MATLDGETSRAAKVSISATNIVNRDVVEAYCALSHREQNKTGKSTLIFIHGAFDSSTSWDTVTPHLPPDSDYHLLLPDLPSHGIASHIKPFSISIAAHLISELISRQAHNGVAKLVGLSLGADVALRIASDFPQVVDNGVFVSGASTPIPVSDKTAASQYLPHAAWLSQRIEWLVPRPLIRSLMDGTDLPRPTLGNCSLELNRQIFAPEDSKWPSPWPARTLIVAAGRGGLLPTEDNADTARRSAEIGRKGNPETLAVVHYDMRHPWSLQAPELFAEAVDAWFREGRVLDKFVPL